MVSKGMCGTSSSSCLIPQQTGLRLVDVAVAGFQETKQEHAKLLWPSHRTGAVSSAAFCEPKPVPGRSGFQGQGSHSICSGKACRKGCARGLWSTTECFLNSLYFEGRAERIYWRTEGSIWEKRSWKWHGMLLSWVIRMMELLLTWKEKTAWEEITCLLHQDSIFKLWFPLW